MLEDYVTIPKNQFLDLQDKIIGLEKQVEAARAEGYQKGVEDYSPVPPKATHTVRARLKPVGRGKPLDQ
jgi:hypothetical protein